MAESLMRRSISETFVRLLYEYLETHGVNAEKALGEPRPEMPQGHAGGFPIVRWVRLLKRAAELLHDPLLGLHLGQTVTPVHFGTLGFLLQSQPTLAAALQRFERYQRLVYDQTPMVQRTGPGYVDFMWGAEQGLPGRFADDTSITVLIHYFRSIAQGPVVPLRVQFIDDLARNPQPYIDCYGCPVEFGSAVTSVRFSTETLALPLNAVHAALSVMMEQQADRLLALLPEETTIAGQIRSVTARLLHDGEPALSTVAKKLNLNPRTVQRRLSDVGSSFRHELQTLRRQMAEAYLRDPHLSIAEVAQLLGYSEHSAFTRSYRQWTGLSPQRWREASGQPTA